MEGLESSSKRNLVGVGEVVVGIASSVFGRRVVRGVFF